MKGFTFKDDVQLKIQGEEFSFDSTDLQIVEKLKKFSKETPKLMEELAKEEDTFKAVKKATTFVTKTIDDILGEGASKKIFKDTPISMLKATQVMDYINDQIIEAREEQSKTYSSNRAQRRAK